MHISVYCCFVSGRYISLGVLLYYWPFGWTICSVVTCEGRITTLSCNPLPSQNPRSSGTSPLSLTSLKRKNHPIVVTLGGIGSCYASLAFKPQAFYPCYKLCDNILASLPGNTKSILLKKTLFGKPCLRESYSYKAYLETPLRVFSLFL